MHRTEHLYVADVKLEREKILELQGCNNQTF